MKVLKVTELLGTPVLLAPEKGGELASYIKNSLGFFSPSVEVDFNGYQFLSSAFLNHAFGQICIDEDWDLQKFSKKVTVKGLDEDDQDDLALALDNAQLRRKLLKEGISVEDFFSKIPA